MVGTERGGSMEGDENWLDSAWISKEEPLKGLHEGFWLEQLDKGVVSPKCLFWKSNRAHLTPLRGERKPSGIQNLLLHLEPQWSGFIPHCTSS